MTRIFKIVLFSVLSIAAFTFLLLPQSVLASTLHLSPGSGNISIGAITNVQVRLNAGGDAVNGISAFLSYPANLLEVAWINPGSAFAIEAEKTYGGGSIKISRGNINGVTGNVNVATIGFRGKSVGKATVSFTGGGAPRASDSSDSLNLGGSSGGVYTVAARAPQPSPTNSAVAQLLISEVLTTSESTNSATINWKTNGRADSLIEYGLEKDRYFLTASDSEFSFDHSIKLENPFLSAGMKLHFRVKSKDEEGREAVSEDQLLQLKGYQVRIKVVDNQDNPVSGMEVLLYSEPIKSVTDQNGEAVFEDISPGKHLVVVKFQDGEESSEIQVSAVDESTALGDPNYSVIKIKKAAEKSMFSWTSPQILLAGAGILVILIIVGAVIIIRRKGKQMGPPTGGIASQETVTLVNPVITNLPK